MSDLAARHAQLRAEATALAGQPADIRQPGDSEALKRRLLSEAKLAAAERATT